MKLLFSFKIASSSFSSHTYENSIKLLSKTLLFSHMALVFMDCLESFISKMDFVSRNNFNSFKLHSLFSIKGVRREWDLLRASFNFWDPEDHVFRFHLDEICPTIEEFSAILDIDQHLPFAVPVLKRSYHETLCEVLGLPLPIVMKMLESRGLNLRLLLEEAQTKVPSSVLESHQKLSALAMAFIGDFLLSSPHSEFADVRISTLIPQLLQGKSIVPIILAETLNGLDAVVRGETSILLGSPHVLQLWLMDRLALIAPPTVAIYKPKHYKTRSLTRPDLQSEKDFLVELCRRTGKHIRWSCPWWQCGLPILRSPGRDHVSVFGLGSNSFYRGDRVFRQFGLRQHIPAEGVPHAQKELTPQLITKIERNLTHPTKADSMSSRTKSFLMSDSYKTWITEKVWIKEAKRIDERKKYLKSLRKESKKKRKREQDS